MKKRIILLLAALAFIAAAAVSHRLVQAQDGLGQINTIDSEGVAIKGYDPVAYFNEGAPRKGDPTISAEHKGAEWHFANEAHREAFLANPEKYGPAYGGYCAYGVSQGYRVKIEPDAWAIRDGKLYLNYDKSVQKTWSGKPDSYIAEANRKWPDLLAKN